MDIDIALLWATLTILQQFEIELALDDLRFLYMMDISIFHKKEKNDLIDHIHSIGIILYVSRLVEKNIMGLISSIDRTVFIIIFGTVSYR